MSFRIKAGTLKNAAHVITRNCADLQQQQQICMVRIACIPFENQGSAVASCSGVRAKTQWMVRIAI
jgi:hypothetical protein